jgi:hypothetical protein
MRGCFLLSGETLEWQLVLAVVQGWEGGGAFCKTGVEKLVGACEETCLCVST